jgi:hypothetical protein
MTEVPHVVTPETERHTRLPWFVKVSPQFYDDVDPDAAKVHIAEIDFRRFAGPLLHWARATGNAETPIWKAMERAVIAAKLDVAPFELIGEL